MKSLPAIIVLLLGLFSCLFQPASVSAASLTSVMVRLDNQTPSSALTGVICATPSTAGAGTEAQLAITFPTDFSISTTTTNWTTATADIPSGTTPWPGIGTTASNVSGKTVTFASSNLTSGTDTYCFTFNGASSTTGSLGQKSGTVVTRDSGNTIIDSSTFGVHITNNQITVQGIVPAAPSDYVTTIEAFPEDLPIRENISINYLVTYYSNLSYPTNITLEAQWSLGTIQGSSVPSVEIVDYVTGSAGKAYNNTPAVIDLTNRKITWTINQIPGDSERHTLTFRLRTNSAYTGKLPVTFTTSTRILGPGTATTPSTLTHTYTYGAASTRPTATPGPTATGTPTPTPIPPVVAISGIRIPTITDTTGRVNISLTAPGSISLRYGTSSTDFTERIVSPAFQTSHLILLEDLTPGTPYYFRAQATSPQGKTVTSDIYTFTTAEQSTPVHVAPGSITITSQKVLLLNTTYQKDQSLPTIVLPQNTPYEVQFSLADKRTIKQLVARVEPYTTSGISPSAFANFIQTQFNETANGVFNGTMQSSGVNGTYVLVVKISDQEGNITEEQLVKIRIVSPFTISSQKNQKPIQRATVQLSQYNEKTRIYEPLTSLPLPNPLLSDTAGVVPLVLPFGKYEARITHPLYQEKVVRFVIGIYDGEDYPQVYLDETSLSLLLYLDYVSDSFFDIFTVLRNFLSSIFRSTHAADLSHLISAGLLFLLAGPFITARLHIPGWKFPKYLKNAVFVFIRNQQYVQIRVVSSPHHPIPHARVISDYYETYTNNNGICIFHVPVSKELRLTIKKHGYKTLHTTYPLSERVHRIEITLQQDPTYHPILEAEKRFFISGIAGIVEVWIIAAFILSLMIGLEKAWPLFVISILNGLLVLYRYYHEAVVRKSEAPYEAVT